MLLVWYLYLREEPSAHYILLKWQMNCKSDNGVTFLTHFVLHDSEYCLVWSNVPCIEMLQNLIMVEIVLSYVNVSSIIAFVDVREDVFYTLHSGAYLHIHTSSGDEDCMGQPMNHLPYGNKIVLYAGHVIYTVESFRFLTVPRTATLGGL